MLVPDRALRQHRRGEVVGRDFLDGRVVCFRGDNGVATVLSAYCRHLGTDLTQGTVVGDELRCGFHYWCYGQRGECTAIPVSNRIPDDSSLFAYPTAESVGLIWAFNGEDPAYEVPSFPIGTPEELALRSDDLGVLPFPTFVGTMNSMDMQHLEVVHGVPNEVDLDAIEVHDSGIRYDMVWHDPSFGRVEQHIEDFGINVVTVTGELAGVRVGMLFAGLPVPGEEHADANAGQLAGHRHDVDAVVLDVLLDPAEVRVVPDHVVADAGGVDLDRVEVDLVRHAVHDLEMLHVHRVHGAHERRERQHTEVADTQRELPGTPIGKRGTS